MNAFLALWVDEKDHKTIATVKETTITELPNEDVLVEIDYSGVNYKDALAITGKGKILRTFPFIPGIDFSGRIVESNDDRWNKDDEVILTGWGVGERYFGGYSQYAKVKPEWLVARPEGLSGEQTMIVGTAGLTAALCVQDLLDSGLKPADGAVVVSGASGGVGSFAIALLSSIGFEVTAVSSKKNNDYLTGLGANNILTLEEMSTPPHPLEKQRFVGAVDCVGNLVLARMLAEMSYGGTVTCCGLASGAQLPTTVMPFILRGVRLHGIDSVMCPTERRQQAWGLIAKYIKPEMIESIRADTISLSDLPDVAESIIENKHRGRYIVKL
ncbi:MAG: acrylyl-CoA reductase (NADPH) [Gammaproteobacteria bacterium]|jgi:acrylyl-CoA reductase (NADPH)